VKTQFGIKMNVLSLIFSLVGAQNNIIATYSKNRSSCVSKEQRFGYKERCGPSLLQASDNRQCWDYITPLSFSQGASCVTRI